RTRRRRRRSSPRSRRSSSPSWRARASPSTFPDCVRRCGRSGSASISRPTRPRPGTIVTRSSRCGTRRPRSRGSWTRWPPPLRPEAKAKILAEIAPIVEPVVAGAREPVDLPRLRAAVRALRQRLDLAADEAPSGHDRDEVVALRDETAALARKLDQVAAAAAPELAPLQDQLRADFARTLGHLKR